jgi:hypothetical protein
MLASMIYIQSNGAKGLSIQAQSSANSFIIILDYMYIQPDGCE